jgi:hypothetical protein
MASNTKEFFMSLSFDVLLLSAITAVFFLLGLRSGKTRLINVVFSLYLATLLILYFPFKHLITFDFGLVFGKYDIVALLLLLVVTMAVQVVVGYVLELEYGGKVIRNTVSSLILSFSSALALLAGAYITSVVKVTDSSISFLDAFYTNEQYLFALLVLPLIGIFLVAR